MDTPSHDSVHCTVFINNIHTWDWLTWYIIQAGLITLWKHILKCIRAPFLNMVHIRQRKIQFNFILFVKIDQGTSTVNGNCVIMLQFSPLPCHPMFVSLGGQIKDGSWWVPEKLPVAHWGHVRPGASAVEGPAQRGLEGQGLVPLGPAAPTSSWLHQVSLPFLLLILLHSAPCWPHVDLQLRPLKVAFGHHVLCERSIFLELSSLLTFLVSRIQLSFSIPILIPICCWTAVDNWHIGG